MAARKDLFAQMCYQCSTFPFLHLVLLLKCVMACSGKLSKEYKSTIQQQLEVPMPMQMFFSAGQMAMGMEKLPQRSAAGAHDHQTPALIAATQ